MAAHGQSGNRKQEAGKVVVMGSVRSMVGRVGGLVRRVVKGREPVAVSLEEQRVRREAVRWYGMVTGADGVTAEWGQVDLSVEIGYPGGWEGLRGDVRAF